MGKLSGRIALVTGAGRGIGRAISLALANEGARLAIVSRTAAELDEVSAAITAAGGQARTFPTNLCDRAELAQLIDRVKDALGPIEILVNNAGVGSSANPKAVVDLEPEFWDHTMELNATVPFLLSQAVLPDMLAAKQGRIITVASINSRTGSLHGAAYAASKHAALGLMRSIAIEVAGSGVTVNCICPGPVKTVMNDRRIQYDADRIGANLEEYERSLTPIGGRLMPDDIAPMAVYLASDDARMVTGQAFNICGGMLMS